MSGTISAQVSDDKLAVTITVADNSGFKTDIVLDADKMHSLIETLGQIRGSMLPRYALDYDARRHPFDGTLTVQDPSWRVSGELIDGKRLLAFRNEFFGWATFLLSQPVADEISKWLVAPAKDPFAQRHGNA